MLLLDLELVMLDEPAAGVSPALESRIMDHIHEVSDQGATFVVIEHDIHVMKTLTDFIFVFDSGSHIAQDDFGSVSQDEAVWEAYPGETTVEEDEMPM